MRWPARIFLVCVLCALASDSAAGLPGYELSDRLADLRIDDAGRVVLGDGQTLTGDQFVRTLDQQQRDGRSRGWLYQIFDITGGLGLVWVTIGFVGQLLFTGRMVVQWLASERSKKSVVPASFWWMSLVGASMLLAYFAWRGDVVGLFGQATGWFIYIRNLWLIYRPRAAEPAVTDDPAPEPQSA